MAITQSSNDLYSAPEAEASVLGSILLEPDSLARVVNLISPQSFTEMRNRVIYESFLELKKLGNEIDIVTLATNLNNKKQIELIGDTAYLAEIQNLIPTSTHINKYAQIIAEKQKLRELAKLGQITKSSIEANTSADNIASSLVSQIKKITTQTKTQAQKPSEIYDVYCEMQSRQGLKTGFSLIDKVTNGLCDNNILTINAFSGAGKTTIACQMLINFLIAGKDVRFYSLEMADWQLFKLLLRILINQNADDPAHKEKSIDFLCDQKNNNLTIINNLFNWDAIYFDAISQNPDVIVLDYLQILDIEGFNSADKIQNLGKKIVQFCRDTNTIAIVLSQISQESANNPDKRVISSKGGNGLFEASDVFVNIIQDFKKESDDRVAIAQDPHFCDATHDRNLIVAKNRLGTTTAGIIKYDFREGAGVYIQA